jgi:polyribonucleotide nucleotidyltransferase
MDKTEIEKIARDEIKKFVKDSLDKEVKKALGSSNSQTRAEMINTIKNAMEAVVKVLWQKKDFWRSDIK